MNECAEKPLVLDCAGAPSVAILHQSVQQSPIGVLIIVGGPQYRIGSHRQFVLLARALADNGIPTLRFDHRGIGDCPGDKISFEQMHEDIRAAIDLFVDQTGIKRVLLWGLCDAASAALMYGPTDNRVDSVVLLNPWVHTEEIEARNRLISYYITRLRSRQFWRNLISLNMDFKDSFASLVSYINKARRPSPAQAALEQDTQTGHFVNRMHAGLADFNGAVYLILSEADISADEFRSLIAVDKAWRRLIENEVTERIDIAGSNHTFASKVWRAEVEQITVKWALSRSKLLL